MDLFKYAESLREREGEKRVIVASRAAAVPSSFQMEIRFVDSNLIKMHNINFMKSCNGLTMCGIYWATNCRP